MKYPDNLIDECRRRLSYDPNTGEFTWLKTGNNYVKPGSKAGGLNDKGYVVINFSGSTYGAHRIAWAMCFGYWPEQIDHINGIPSDNRLSNLRNVCQIENSRNAKRRKDNISGLPGVHFLTSRARWVARISVSGERRALGYHADFFEACCARKSAERKHNFHINHGRNQRVLP